jgi:hypothetical protein
MGLLRFLGNTTTRRSTFQLQRTPEYFGVDNSCAYGLGVPAQGSSVGLIMGGAKNMQLTTLPEL